MADFDPHTRNREFLPLACTQLEAQMESIFEPWRRLARRTGMDERSFVASQLWAREIMGRVADGDSPSAWLVLDGCWPRRAAPSPAWWNSALGILIAWNVCDSYPGTMSQQEAADILDVARPTVHQMILKPGQTDYSDGQRKLIRGPDGVTVTGASVLHRLQSLRRTLDDLKLVDEAI